MTTNWKQSYIFLALTLILLITTIVVFDLFYDSTKSLLLGMKCVSEDQDLQYLRLNKTNISDFQPLEIVGRRSETQLRVDENLNNLT